MIHECIDRGKRLVSRMTLVVPDPSQIAPYRAKIDGMGEDIMAMYRAAAAARRIGEGVPGAG